MLSPENHHNMCNWGRQCEAKRITRKLAVTAPIGMIRKSGDQAIRESEQGLKVRDLLCSEHVTSTTNEGKAEQGEKTNKQTHTHRWGLESNQCFT